MGRTFNPYGETIILVRGNGSLGLNGDPQTQELGLCVQDGLKVIPRFYHKDIKCDDFGPDVGPEVMWNLGEVLIQMTLVHYDEEVLKSCMDNSMCGSDDGTLAPAGRLMGGSRALDLSSEFDGQENNFIGLYLLSISDVTRPWHFLATYLTTPYPVEIPIGVDRSLVKLNWRAIPYKAGITGTFELSSNGVKLWDRILPPDFTAPDDEGFFDDNEIIRS